jgi:hypothetical protein
MSLLHNTGPVSWGTRIRTSTNGVRVRCNFHLFKYLAVNLTILDTCRIKGLAAHCKPRKAHLSASGTLAMRRSVSGDRHLRLS